MIRNYLKIAVRNILKHKFFSIINLTGLVTGITCCLLLFIYVQDELSYDRFHVGYENIYRVGLHGKLAGQEILTPTSCIPLGPTMKDEIPGIEAQLRLIPARRKAFRYEDKSFIEDNVYYADSNFFEFFTFKLIQGDPSTVLKEPNTIVISRSTAVKYFGEADPVGKILIIGNDKTATRVSGVAEDAPSNSHFHFTGIASYITIEKTYQKGWTGNSMFTYIRKSPKTSEDEINKTLETIVQKYVGAELEAGLGVSFENFRKQGGIYSYFVYPIADSHLLSVLPDDMEPSGSMQNVYIFSGVALFILILACVNFMNLSTAQSAGRAKEVGLRKTLGSKRGQMIGQFLAESFVYSLGSVVLAIAAAFLILPSFNILTGKSLTLASLTSWPFAMVAATLIVVVGFLAGSYPALYLTSFKAVEVLKGKVKSGLKSKGVRSSLVVFQFAVSTFLIIATGVVFQQLSFMQDKNLGLDNRQVITVAGMNRLGTNRQGFRDAVQNEAGIVSTSFTDNAFPGMGNTSVVRVKGRDVDYLSGIYHADWDHLELMKMTLLDGRFFSRDFPTDTAACVINEAAAKEFGLENPVGQELTDYNQGGEQLKVIGVVKDFNFETLKAKIRPVVIRLTNVDRELLVRYQGNPAETVAGLEKQWKALAPGEPFEFTFLDQDFDALFRSELRLRNIFTVFSSLAIFIACLGLFALAAFTTEQRTKEIGVRKALGASGFALAMLLSKEFTRLVIIAIVPAVVAGWLIASWWLKDFPYRMELSPLLFVGSALAALAIAWITVSYQSIKAAKTNPVTSLRYE